MADPLLENGPQNPHTIARRLAQAFFRGKALVVLLTALGGLVAGFVALAQPNVYESHATFLFRHGSESLPVDPGLNLNDRRGPDVAGNAPHLLQAPELMHRVVDRMGVQKVMQPFRPNGAVHPDPSGWFGSIVGWVYQLQRSLHDVDPSQFGLADAEAMVADSILVEPFRRARLLQVSYYANDPSLAQEMLTAYVEEAKLFHMQVYGDREAIQLVEARHETAKKRHAAAKEALSSFLEKLQVHDFMAEYELARATETTARDRTLELRIEIRTLEARLKTLKTELAKTEPFIIEKGMEEVPNPRIAILTNQILAMEREIVTARTHVRENQPEVGRLTEALNALKGKLAEELKRPAVTKPHVARVANPDYQHLRDRLADTEQRLSVARETLVEIEARLAAATERLEFLGSHLDHFRDLDQTNNERREDLRRAEDELGVAQDKQRLNMSNLSALSLVVPPSRAMKIGPERKRMVLLGLLAGFAMALGILAVLTMVNTTVRSPEELEELVGLRVLACVPQLDRKNLYRHEKRLASGC